MVTVDGHEKLCRLVNACRQGADNTTPMSLVQEMIDKIPEEIWKDTSATILDPAAGTGTFLVAAYWKMIQAGDTHENIISNRLFACEINLVYLKIIKDKLGIKNIYDKDFLQLDLDMKFDVVIGNPPYQLKETNSRNTKLLFTEFTYKAKELGKNVLFVLPSNYLEGNKGPLKKFRKFIKNNGLDSISDDKSQHFTVNTAGISYVYLKEESKATYTFGEKVIKNDYSDSKIVKNGELVEIYNKLIGFKSKMNVSRGKRNIYLKATEKYSDTPTEEFTVPMFIKTVKKEPRQVYVKPDSKSDIKTTHFGLVTQDWNKKDLAFNKIWYREDKYFTSNLNFIYFLLEEYESFDSLVSYMNSNVFKFLLFNSDNGSRAISIGSLKNFPAVVFDKEWSNVELYEFFNLTQEEINLIESTVA